MQFEAEYYNGISPHAQRVLELIVDQHFSFTIFTGNANETISHEQINFLINHSHVQARLGNSKRLIDLPIGNRLETDFKDLELYLPAKSANKFW